MPGGAEQLKDLIKKLSMNQPRAHNEKFFIMRFQQGGMFSGFIFPEFWVARDIQALIKRRVKRS